MIGKQLKGRGFRGLLNYLEEKEEAELIGGNMIGENARELAAEFRFIRQLNHRVERPVYHASLSLQKGENLDNETWNEIAKEYLIGMGFDYNQYCVFRHRDQDHDHIHIAASRIKLDGTCVHDGWDFPRSERLIRQLEKQYGLESPVVREPGKRSPTTGERRLLEKTGKESERVRLQNALDEALPENWKAPELIKHLRTNGIDASVSYYSTGNVRGITYKLIDSDMRFSGTQLGANYTFPNGLAKSKGMTYEPERDDEALASANLIEVFQGFSLLEDELMEEESDTQPESLQSATQSISQQQRDYAAIISPIAVDKFNYESNQGRVEKTSSDTLTVKGRNYCLSWQTEERVFSLLATDGRGELLRMREDSSGVSQLEWADKITYSDVERWNQINQQLQDLERQRQLEAERQKILEDNQIEY